MLKAFSGICVGMMVVAGCSGVSGEITAPAQSAPKTVDAGRLRSALLSAPSGMRVSYGPESGPYGSLKATKQGEAAMQRAKLHEPGCSGIGQLDSKQMASSPAAVVAFSSDKGTITEALVATTVFPGPLPARCADYKATVGTTKVTYKTVTVEMPKLGEESRAFITTATSKGTTAQIGAVLVRRAGVVVSLLVVGADVQRDGLIQLGRLADEQLAKTLA
ncbi:hypothetical protein OIE66_39280 [Nonomuraea sp. NBC_01738]|uniref:hypothetical protein n=1 Tax=Nonomuraea sp. NBC_01738 TaxID=2976003 RepID=UPI002E165251|nr:hypothetical protein OIE66_39280 [Nonomuraea sp. NBC_01738]